MKINYSLVAQEEYIEVVYYLADKFGEAKAIKFEEDFLSNLEQLQNFSNSFGSFYKTNKRKFMVNRNVTVIFQVDEITGMVEILNFWFNRSNPEVLLKHL
jgi:plasmid stabilization system protein ParE